MPTSNTIQAKDVPGLAMHTSQAIEAIEVCRDIRVIVGANTSAGDRCAEQRFRYKLDYDRYAENPYEGYDDIIIVSTTRNHDFGNTTKTVEECNREYGEEGFKRYAIRGYLPGGLAIKLASDSGSEGYPYNCPWDSGVAGFIYVNPKHYPESREAAKSAIDLVNAWINGEIMELCVIYDGGDKDGEVEHYIGGIYPNLDKPSDMPDLSEYIGNEEVARGVWEAFRNGR